MSVDRVSGCRGDESGDSSHQQCWIFFALELHGGGVGNGRAARK